MKTLSETVTCPIRENICVSICAHTTPIIIFSGTLTELVIVLISDFCVIGGCSGKSGVI